MPRRATPGRPEGQYTQAVRLFRLHQLLEGRPNGVHVDALADELAVTPRSIRRDLKALETAGIALESVEIAGERRVRVRAGRTTDPIRLTRYQRYSLFAVRRVFDVFTGTPLHDDFAQLFAKLMVAGEDEAAMAERFLFIPDAPRNYRRLKDTIYEVYDGILRSLPLQFHYDGGTTAGTRKIEPYGLVLYQNRLYVVGRDVVKNADRTFAIDLMKRVRALSSSPFTRDPDFDVARLFDGSFGIFGGGTTPHHVVVDFDARLAPHVEPREWHRTQRMTRLASGDLRVEFDTTGLTEVVTWVLRWGGGAVVREPAELRDRVRDELDKARARYA